MNPDISTALDIFGVGMVTIFGILGLVVLTGQLLIRLVNRISPATPPASSTPPSSDIPEVHIAVIQATVETITHGQGRVSSISSANA